jgi:MOSC domain-containing protein YiiM
VILANRTVRCRARRDTGGVVDGNGPGSGPGLPAGAATPVERCAECGFDGARWTDQDVVTSLVVAQELWRGYLQDAPQAVLQTRAEPGRWSVAEYTDHLREVMFGARLLATCARDTPGLDLGPEPGPADLTPEVRTIDLPAALMGLAVEAHQLRTLLDDVGPSAWPEHTVTFGGHTRDLGWIGRHALHDLMHHLHDIGRIRVALGDGVAPQRGTVVQLNVSDGGVPKRPVEALDVDWNGPVGDRQGDRKHHGRPFQAVSLWGTDVIDALVAEGHPIEPGLAGENLTITGLTWADLRPGARLRIGGLEADLSCYATPCAKNAAWFADGDFHRIDQDRHPGWSRLYATVTRPGRVEVGDGVEIEPPATQSTPRVGGVSRAPTG